MNFPVIPATLPRRGNRATAWLAQAALTAFGWRVVGNFPPVAKLVAVLAPHTSNWDTVVGVGAKFALGIRVTFLAKDSLFRWPMGGLMRWVGAIPVDRTAPHGVVGEAVADFAQHDKLVLALAPEGTRRKGVPWREGFYHIARGANVPIIPVTVDYRRRVLAIGPALWPTGDRENEVARLKAFCSGSVAGDEAPPVSAPPR